MPADVPGQRLCIQPEADPGNDPSIFCEWQPVELGPNQSVTWVASSSSGGALTVTVEQLPYRRSFQGTGGVAVPAVPLAPAGTSGRLVVTDETTGTSAEFTWCWQPPGKGARAPGARAAPGRGLLGRLGAAVGGKKQGKAAQKQAAQGATAAEEASEAAPDVVAQTAFFGRPAVGSRFAFILDMSGSMVGQRWATCTRELGNALTALPPDAEFFVVLFAARIAEPPGQRGWTKAAPERVAATLAWIGSIRPDGGTYPKQAFERVFSLGGRPDAVYFLTDGVIEGFTPRDCSRLRKRGTSSLLGSGLSWLFSRPGQDDSSAVINTIALDDDASPGPLQKMAEESGGAFVQVSSRSG